MFKVQYKIKNKIITYNLTKKYNLINIHIFNNIINIQY